ncbi:hypothetical protein [Microvirga aerophila]|uniref:ABC transporter permease n=1 Tax=Microvirga aerophila TaxID=670291 RepID=A0A512BW66_9HYPH|nr:hypothetical protein [Microvirga aerophila]GEO16202.1 hypothetical protein MAE02_38980 [Microvirga aerophila]
MIRMLVALVAANVAAPFLLSLYILARITLDDPTLVFSSIESSLLVSLAIFYAGLGEVFLSAFPISLLLALAERYFRWRAPWIYLVAGAITGVGFTLLTNDWHFPGSPFRQPIFPLTVVIGAVCGWIYWRIATGGRTKAPLA